MAARMTDTNAYRPATFVRIPNHDGVSARAAKIRPMAIAVKTTAIASNVQSKLNAAMNDVMIAAQAIHNSRIASSVRQFTSYIYTK